MKEIAQGVYSKFTETTGGVHNSLHIAVSGRMYHTEAPQDVEFPYIVFSFISQVPEYTFSDDFENVVVQFSIFSLQNSSLEVEDLRSKLMTLYDWTTLTVTGYSNIYMRRISNRLLRDDRPSWHYAMDYRVFVRKS